MITLCLAILIFLALLPMMAIASDADPEQDFCVADPNNPTIGDVFVFPRGLLHFELNVCDGTATAIAALNSQNPGTQIQAVALFNSGISEVVLEKAFGLGEKAVQKIELLYVISP
ncbi:unnamed protein product [Sphagnum jensenii]